MNQRQPVRAQQWSVRRRLEVGYFNDLNRMVQARLNQISPEALDPGSVAAISSDPSFIAAVEALVSRMMLNLDQDNARSWRQAAHRAMRGKEIFAALKQEQAGQTGVRWRDLAAQHSAKIVSLPDYLAQVAAKHFTEQAHTGRRSIDIARDLKGTLSSLTRSHVAMLARTEVSSASTAFTRARSERMGIGWYEWLSSKDGRVRESHRNMAGVLVAWDDPPAPEALIGEKGPAGHYHAGMVYNCRCPAAPLVSLDEVSWPHKVYSGGVIQRMTRAQFELQQGAARAA
jgi:SPP1 gp7 family putative phage head morphogenesis protein